MAAQRDVWKMTDPDEIFFAGVEEGEKNLNEQVKEARKAGQTLGESAQAMLTREAWADLQKTLPNLEVPPAPEPWTAPRPVNRTGAVQRFFDQRVGGLTIGAPQEGPSVGPATSVIPTMNRQNGARLIIILSAGTALAIVLKGSHGQAGFLTAGGHTVLVSVKIRQYAALVIVTTIALVVNEISPAVAVGLMLVLALDVLVNTGVITRIGDALGGQPIQVPVPNDPTQVPGAATSKESQDWINSHLGQWPHPGKGRNDFWNALAESAAKAAGVPMQGNP